MPGSRQSERDDMKNHILELYKIPYLRFITNGSGEARLNVRLNPSNYIFTVTDGLEVVSSPVHVLSTIRTSDISMFYKDEQDLQLNYMMRMEK